MILKALKGIGLLYALKVKFNLQEAAKQKKMRKTTLRLNCLIRYKKIKKYKIRYKLKRKVFKCRMNLLKNKRL